MASTNGRMMPPGSSSRRVLYDHVDQRHVDVVDARHAEQAQRGALGRVGGVLLDVLLDVVGDRRRPRRGRGRPGTGRAGWLGALSHRPWSRGSVRVERRTASGTVARPLTTSNTGARSPTASATAPKKSCRVVGLRHPVRVGGHGKHAQRRRARAASMPRRRRRETVAAGSMQHGRVAHHDASGAGAAAGRGRGRRRTPRSGRRREAASWRRRRSISRATITPSPTAVSSSRRRWPRRRPSMATARASSRQAARRRGRACSRRTREA